MSPSKVHYHDIIGILRLKEREYLIGEAGIEGTNNP